MHRQLTYLLAVYISTLKSHLLTALAYTGLGPVRAQKKRVFWTVTRGDPASPSPKLQGTLSLASQAWAALDKGTTAKAAADTAHTASPL